MVCPVSKREKTAMLMEAYWDEFRRLRDVELNPEESAQRRKNLGDRMFDYMSLYSSTVVAQWRDGHIRAALRCAAQVRDVTSVRIPFRSQNDTHDAEAVQHLNDLKVELIHSGFQPLFFNIRIDPALQKGEDQTYRRVLRVCLFEAGEVHASARPAHRVERL